MPLPNLKTGESKGVFITRCMSDPEIRKEFKTTQQRAAVCQAQYVKGLMKDRIKETRKHLPKKKKKKK